MDDLEALLLRIIEHKVEFVVIGGFACVAHGATFFTRDVDICCPFTVENLMRLQHALHDLHPVHRMTPEKLPLALTPDNCRLMKNLYIGTDYGELDCLSFVDGVGNYAAAEKDSIETQVADGPCRILGIDALIRSKEAAGRRRDMEAAIQLRAIKERLQQDN